MPDTVQVCVAPGCTLAEPCHGDECEACYPPDERPGLVRKRARQARAAIAEEDRHA